MMLLSLLALFGYNVYFADLHAHTSYSDGQGLPAQAYTYARDTARIDVLGLTDHTHYMSPGEYTQEREIAAQFCEDGQFVALAGQEFGSLAEFGHFSIYDADSLCPVSVSDLSGFYAWLAGVHEPAQFNHPSLVDFNSFAYDRAADSFATTLEVVNGGGVYTPVNESLYFEALRRGWHCAPVANQDNHRKHWGDAQASTGEIPLTGILADTLTKDAILDALIRRHVYAMEVTPATDRINLKQFSIGATTMGASATFYDSLANMTLEVNAGTDFRQLYLYRNGLVLDSAARSADSLPPSLDTNVVVWSTRVPTNGGYYLVKGVQQDSDHFWTAPIWVTYQAPRKALEFWPNPFSTRTRIVFPPNEHRNADIDEGNLEIFDASGTLVYHFPPGWYVSPSDIPEYWDGTSSSGKSLANGIYYVKVVVHGDDNKDKVYYGKVAIKR